MVPEYRLALLVGNWIWGQVCKGIVGNQPTALLGQASSNKRQATSLPQSGDTITKNRKEKIWK